MLFILYVCFLLWCTGGTTEAVVQLPPNVTIPAVFAFGDSIVDQGCNNYFKTIVKCDFPPYGKDFAGGVPTGRFSNGKTPPDMLVFELGIKEFVPPYLDPNLQIEDLPTGVSFASGGMGYDPETPKISTSLSFPDQLDMFKEYIGKLKESFGEERTSYILSNSLFVVIAGSDDLANTYFTIGIQKLIYDIPSYADLLVSYASNFTQELYGLGARRIAIFGAPPIGCIPVQRTLAGGPHRDCVDTYNQATQIYNTQLSSKLDSLTQTLPNSNIFYVDVFNPMIDIIQNSHKYGIDIVDKGCCGTGIIEVSVLCNKLSKTCSDSSKYLFWDSYHPSESGYQILVDYFFSKYIDRLL